MKLPWRRGNKVSDPESWERDEEGFSSFVGNEEAKEPVYLGNSRRYGGESPEYNARAQNAWLNRIVAGLLFICVAEAFVIAGLFPQVRFQPVVLELSDRVLKRVVPVRNDVEGVELAREAFVRRYVLDRETINLVDENERWAWVRRYSTKGVWNPFFTQVADRYENLVQQGISRSIKINTAFRAGENRDNWTLEFDRKTYRVGVDEPTIETWFAHVRITQSRDLTDKRELLDNPFQLVVRSYSIAKKEDVTGE